MPGEKQGALARLPSARLIAIDSLVIFLLAGALIFKLFVVEYLRNWDSIESTFVADSRILEEHLPHPGWQPLWYCGTRFDYIYPPALRYTPALLSKAAGISTARAYHLYTAVLYAFGIMAVYWLVLAGARSRLMAWVCAAGAALVSPSFALLEPIRNDSAFLVPQRLHVMLAYGEGPHISSLSLLGAALAASILAFRSRRLLWVALAGLACALVVANNFYGATALAIFFPLALWTEWLGRRDNLMLLKAAGIAALAWGFCAFWLTPSYIHVTMVNLSLVADPTKRSSVLLTVIFLALLAGATWRFGNRRPERSWALFAWSSAAVLLFYIAGYYFIGLEVTGDPRRLIPEMDLALILAAGQAAFWCWERKRLRIVTVVLALAALYPAAVYLRHFKFPFQRERHLESQYEYQLSSWVHQNLPGQRTLPSGSLRLWYDAWWDNPQTDGGSKQGIENQNLMTAMWQVGAGKNAEPAILWLQALGTDAVIVPDATSLDRYHDYADPGKFQGALPQLFDNGHGTRVYRVPRRFPDLARVVEASREAALVPISGGDDLKGLRGYVQTIEAGPDEAAILHWHGLDAYDVETTLAGGQELLVQETYDPAWRASAGGLVLKTHPDVMGFTLIDAPPGPHKVEMRFETPAENQMGYAAFFLTCGIFLWLAFSRSANVEKSTDAG